MKPIFNRAPLTPNMLAPLSLGSIRPEDWLYDQLRTQADGLSGELCKRWNDVNEKSVWFGSDDWECALSDLDGLIALAWTLDDESLKAACTKRIEWLLESQREDGWFGPEDNDDYWPLMIALKAMRQYFTATSDKRVLVLMDKFFKYQYRNLSEHPLRDWAVARGGENMELALWLYNITGQKYLIELCRRLRAQTLDWPNFFHTFSNATPMSRALKWQRLQEGMQEERDDGEWLEGEIRPYFQSQYHQTHGVNIAMGLKTPGVISLFKSGFKEQGGFKFGWAKLMKHHGVAYGMFTADGHLNSANPVQGTDLSSVVELMSTLETLIGIGDFGPEVADILEKLAYNALPGMFNADMTAHQRIQQANQIKAAAGPRKWYNASDNANLYGTVSDADNGATSYHQAWPKFAASLWYATNDGGLAATSYAPCTVRTVAGGVPVRLRVSGGYPFAQTVSIEVAVKQPVEFPLYLRVPFWARQPIIYLPDGEIMQVRANEMTCVRRKWRSGDVIRLELPAAPRLTHWYHQSGAVEIGPLLMALCPEERWTQLEDGNWQVDTDAPWNWALLREEPMKVIYEPEKAAAFGKGKSAVRVLVKAVKTDWSAEGANTANIPMAPKAVGDMEIVELVPYGDTALHIAQFPVTAPLPSEDR